MNNFLQQYIKYCEVFYKDSFMILLDTDLIARYVGDKYLQVVNKTADMVIDKQLHQTAQVPQENIEPSFKAFEKAITQNKIVPVIIANLYHKTDDNILIFGATIYPVSEPETKKVVCVRFEFYQVNLEVFFEALIKNVDKITPNDLADNDEFLTRREHQIAFLLFYCNDYTEIAKVISIYSNKIVSEKTIRNIVNQYLYPKFKVNNKSTLMAKLREQRYDKRMPNSLLTNRFIDISR